MNKVLRGILAVGFLGLAAGSASASITFNYESNPLLSKPDSTPYGSLSIFLEFSDDGSTLLDWLITQPHTGSLSKAEADLQQANGLNYPNQFAIYTDDNGNVSDWSISVLNLLEENTSSNAHSVYYASYSDLSRSDYNDSFSLYNFTPTPELAALAYEPGTWSISSQMNNFAFTETFNYETPSPIPEPSTYLMLLAGLGLLGWKRFSA